MPDKDNSKRSQPRKALFVIRLAAWGIGGLLFLTLLPIAALHIPSIQKAVILGVVTRIEAATNFKVQIRSFQWRPFSCIYLTEVKVESGETQVLDCGKVRIKCRPSIKRPFIIIEEVYLEKPFLQLEREASGRWLIPASAGAKGQGRGHGEEPFWSHIQLPRIQIISGTIQARQQGNTILSIKDISGVVNLKSVQGSEGPEIRLDFENLHARAQMGELNAARGVYNFQGKELKIIEGPLVFTGTPEGEPQLRILCQKAPRCRPTRLPDSHGGGLPRYARCIVKQGMRVLHVCVVVLLTSLSYEDIGDVTVQALVSANDNNGKGAIK